MLPIQPNPAPQEPTAKTTAPRNPPEAGVFETFLSVFGEGETHRLLPDTQASSAAPDKPHQVDKRAGEFRSQSAPYEGQGGDDETASEGSSTSVPLDAQTEVRVAQPKPAPPVSMSEDTTHPTTFHEGRSEPEPNRPDTRAQSGQSPTLGVVADAAKPVSIRNVSDSVLAGSSSDTQARSTERENTVEPAPLMTGTAPVDTVHYVDTQRRIQPEKANIHAAPVPVKGQDGSAIVANKRQPDESPSPLIPGMPKTAAPAGTTVPNVPKSKVETSELAGSKSAGVVTDYTAPNTPTPSPAQSGGAAPQITPHPTPARVSTNPATPKVSATDEFKLDGPISRHTATPERVMPQQTTIIPPSGNAPPLTPPSASVAPIPTLPADRAEDQKRVLDPALPDIRFNAEAVLRPGISPSQASHAPDLPRHIAQQMADAVHRSGGDRGVDLLLNPAELGRVRISLSPSEAGMTVQILADRPETLDLIRRHIDLLAQDFHSLGYEATEFAFAQHQGGAQNGTNQNSSHPMDSLDDDAPEVVPNPTTAILADRVDIRL